MKKTLQKSLSIVVLALLFQSLAFGQIKKGESNHFATLDQKEFEIVEVFFTTKTFTHEILGEVVEIANGEKSSIYSNAGKDYIYAQQIITEYLNNDKVIALLDRKIVYQPEGFINQYLLFKVKYEGPFNTGSSNN